MNKKTPLRMCVCCREMKDKKSLLRIVKDKENNISIDITGKANGRGAYICNEKNCFDKLSKQKVLNKVFKCNISDQFYNEVEDAVSSKG